MGALGGNRREGGILAVTGDRSVTLNDHSRTLNVTASGSAVTVTLPSAATMPDGFVVVVRRHESSTANVVLAGGVSRTLTGAAEGVICECSGSEWVYYPTQGPTGATGAAGQGVPTGGTSGQALVKNSGTDFDTVWGAAGIGDHAHNGTDAQKLTQANTHESADTDSAETALHHTIGPDAHQAASGNPASGGGTIAENAEFLVRIPTEDAPPAVDQLAKYTVDTVLAHVRANVKLDDLAAPDDNTDRNVSTSAHGLTPKAPNNTTQFLRGDATWATPAGGASVESGRLEMTANSTAPSGWLLCDGAAVSRTTYADLYTAIGTTYGAGDGTTTFNVPDMRGRSPMGVGTGTGGGASGTGLPTGGSALTAVSRASWLGAETHTLTEAQLASHTHAYYCNTSLTAGSYYVFQSTVMYPKAVATTGYVTNTGSGSAHNNQAPRMGVNFIIKT